MSSSATALPLADLTVLDLSRVVAGPYASMMLGDAGANVIKIERPGVGDDTRSWGPPFLESDSEDHPEDRLSTYFCSINRSKKSVAVDGKSAAGRQLLQTLAAKADVVLENFRPGKVAALGLDYETVKERNPDVVYASVSGFGQTGPLAERPGYDLNIGAQAGLLSITGQPDGPPARPGVALVDIITGLHTYSAILAALRRRDQLRTQALAPPEGAGCYIDASLFNCCIASLINAGTAVANVTDPEQRSRLAQRWGTAHESIVPYQGFTVADGDVVISANSDVQWLRLCSALGGPRLEALAADEELSANAGRVRRRSEVVGAVQERLGELGWTRDETAQRLSEAGVATTPVRSVQETLDPEVSPQTAARGAVQSVEHETIGALNLLAPPLRNTAPGTASGDPLASIRSAPPLLGQHSRQVLVEELGVLTVSEFEGAVADGWIGSLDR